MPTPTGQTNQPPKLSIPPPLTLQRTSTGPSSTPSHSTSTPSASAQDQPQGQAQAQDEARKEGHEDQGGGGRQIGLIDPPGNESRYPVTREPPPECDDSENFFDVPGWLELSDVQRAWVIEYLGCWDAGEAAVRIGLERCDGWMMRSNGRVRRILRRMQDVAASERVMGLTEAMEILTGTARTSVADFFKDDGSGELDMEKVRKDGRYLDQIEVTANERYDKDGGLVGVKKTGKVRVDRKGALVVLAKLRGWDLRGVGEQEKSERALSREASVHGIESGDDKGGGRSGGFRLTMCLTARKPEGEGEDGGMPIALPEPVMLPGRRIVGGTNLEIDVKNQAVNGTDVACGSGELVPVKVIEPKARPV